MMKQIFISVLLLLLLLFGLFLYNSNTSSPNVDKPMSLPTPKTVSVPTKSHPIKHKISHKHSKKPIISNPHNTDNNCVIYWVLDV